MAEKRVCDICGTVYNAALDSCPLCDTPYRPKDSQQHATKSKYKDGNGTKKAKAAQDRNEPGWKVAIAVFLSVLMVLFGAFIAYEFLIGSPSADSGVACTGLYLSEDTVELTAEGEQANLQVRVTPDDTTDTISYASQDPQVATVDSMGRVTAVAEGETVITVTCGSYSASCTVTCTFEE